MGVGEVEAPHYGKEGLGWLRKKALLELFSRDFEPLDRGGPKAG